MRRLLPAAVLFLVPLLSIPGAFLYYDITPKVVVLPAGAAMGLALTDPRMAWRAIWSNRFGPALFLLIAAQCLSLIVSTALSAAPALSFAGANWRRFGLVTQLALMIFLVLFAAELKRRPGVLWLRAIPLAVVVAVGWAAVQYAIESLQTRTVPVWETPRPGGPAGHPVYLANYLAGAAFLCFAAATRETRRAWRRFGQAAGALGLFGILLTGTRAAILGALVGAVVAAVFLRLRWRLRYGFWAAALLLFYLSPAGSLLRGRVRHWMQDPLGGPRLALWRDTAGMAVARPLLGFGPESFSREFPAFESAGLAARYPDSYHESPHNVWLDALVSQGAIGLAILMGVAALAVLAAWRGPEPAAWRGLLLAAWGASAFAHLFACFTLPPALYFWLAPVLLVAGGEPGGEAGGDERPAIRMVTAAPALALLAAALLLARADLLLAAVQRHMDAGRLEAAAAGYRAARRWPLPGYTSDLWYSRALIFAADRAGRAPEFLREATDAAGRAALQAEDRHNALYHLALLQTSARDLAAAQATLRLAIGVAPNWYKPHWLLAEVLKSAGRLREALAEANTACALHSGDEPVLRDTRKAVEEKLASEGRSAVR